MTDLPENVDLQWLGRTLLAMRQDIVDIKSDLRAIREDLNLLTVRVMRIDTALTAVRDDVRELWIQYGDLRRRVEVIEGARP